MNRSDRQPLTTEERLLAERLGGDGHGPSPSPAIDSAILAAARASATQESRSSAASGARQPGHARRRWPLAAGLAASLALALGIAWQLRPAPAALEARARPEMPAPAPAVARMVSPDRAPRTDAGQPLPISASPQVPEAPAAIPPPSEARAAGDVVSPAPATDGASAAPPTQARRNPVSPQPEAGTALGADAFAAPAAAPAAVALQAPTALPAPTTGSPVSATPAAANVPANAAPRTAAPAPPAATTRAAARVTWTDAIDDVPDDSDPPATADSPEVRAAWLVRVRELLDAGRIAEAKASLAEFHRRHPQAELPPDLRALLD